MYHSMNVMLIFILFSFFVGSYVFFLFFIIFSCFSAIFTIISLDILSSTPISLNCILIPFVIGFNLYSPNSKTPRRSTLFLIELKSIS
ncbi:hypothetical protein HanPSC8_Chr09g0400951 [Helianthus annuus]|nr:hypothetical protein HanPSC8_Chr09g0400951 [Helianthus annuus]